VALGRWLEQTIRSLGVRTVLGTVLQQADLRDDGRIETIELASRYGNVTVRAEGFVDASGDAALTWQAGLPCWQPERPIYGSQQVIVEHVDESHKPDPGEIDAMLAARGEEHRALPARHLGHRGLVRRPGGLRRRRRHRPLARLSRTRGTPVISLHGRTVVPGYAEGEALVSPEPISGWGGIDPAAGRIIEPGHVLNGVGFTGKVLVFPSAKGSSGWSGFFQSTRLLGTAGCSACAGRTAPASPRCSASSGAACRQTAAGSCSTVPT
jgi:hypothetical protein